MSTSAVNPTTNADPVNKPILSSPRTATPEANDGPPNDGGTGNTLGGLARAAFGCYLVIFLITLVYVLLKIWPEKPAVDSAVFFGRWTFALPTEHRYLVIVIIAGALGSFVHLATSFADFVGNRLLKRSWMWWYMLRPFIGIALALLFYFAFRGGLMTASSSTTDLSVFGVAAMSGLAGMFSKQVTDKLREICDTAFTAVKSSPQRADSMTSDGKAQVAGAGK
jgi:hypothetical protein